MMHPESLLRLLDTYEGQTEPMMAWLARLQEARLGLTEQVMQLRGAGYSEWRVTIPAIVDAWMQLRRVNREFAAFLLKNASGLKAEERSFYQRLIALADFWNGE